MPLVLLPSACLMAASVSLVPEISEACAVKQDTRISKTVSATFLFTSVIGFGAAAPVDSYVTPIPYAMPGYNCDVIMAAGAFIQGSSIELSADGPIRAPYSVYFQGGLTWFHAKTGILMSLQKLYEKGLVKI